jgi:hypothetical protein
MFSRRSSSGDLTQALVDTVPRRVADVLPDDLTGAKIYDAIEESVGPMLTLHKAGVLPESVAIFTRAIRNQARMDPSTWERSTLRCVHDLDAMLHEKREERKKKPRPGLLRRIRPYAVGAVTGVLAALVLRDLFVAKRH